MGELGDILGEDFEKKYEESVQKSREATRRVNNEQMRKICYYAIHGDGLEPENPRFSIEIDGVEHDVLLMEAPDENFHEKFVFDFKNSDGKSASLFHMNQLFSCAFNDGMQEMIPKIREGRKYLVVGDYTVKKQYDDDGNVDEKYHNVSVRGMVPIEKAKELAEKYSEEKDESSVEEMREEQQDDSDSSEDSDDVDISIDDEEEEPLVDEDVIVAVCQKVHEAKPAILQGISDGNSSALDKLVGHVENNTEKRVTKDIVNDVAQEYIKEFVEDEDEEEEDEIVIGNDDESESSDSSSDDSDSAGKVDDWFDS